VLAARNSAFKPSPQREGEFMTMLDRVVSWATALKAVRAPQAGWAADGASADAR
jgi:hypothetical protein